MPGNSPERSENPSRSCSCDAGSTTRRRKSGQSWENKISQKISRWSMIEYQLQDFNLVNPPWFKDIFSTLCQDLYNQTIRTFIAELSSQDTMPCNFNLPIGSRSTSPQTKRLPSPQTLRTAMAIAGTMLERANNSVSPSAEECVHNVWSHLMDAVSFFHSPGPESIAKCKATFTDQLLLFPCLELKAFSLLCHAALCQPCEESRQSDGHQSEQHWVGHCYPRTQ